MRGVRYFSCAPKHGLFVQQGGLGPEVSRAAAASDPAAAWSAMESVLESEALQAARQSKLMLDHLSQKHPQPGAARMPPPPVQVKRSSSAARELQQLSGDDVYEELLKGLEVPADYKGPSFEQRPTTATMEALLKYVKRKVAAWEEEGSGEAVPPPVLPAKHMIRLLLWVKHELATRFVPNVSELKIKGEERVVIVGDTHGQLADFVWILRSHGLPSKDNVYLINGDVADRGPYACEILILAFGFMLAQPGSLYINRGNHESIDMNIRGFHEGGGFAIEVRLRQRPS